MFAARVVSTHNIFSVDLSCALVSLCKAFAPCLTYKKGKNTVFFIFFFVRFVFLGRNRKCAAIIIAAWNIHFRFWLFFSIIQNHHRRHRISSARHKNISVRFQASSESFFFLHLLSSYFIILNNISDISSCLWNWEVDDKAPNWYRDRFSFARPRVHSYFQFELLVALNVMNLLGLIHIHRHLMENFLFSLSLPLSDALRANPWRGQSQNLHFAHYLQLILFWVWHSLTNSIVHFNHK